MGMRVLAAAALAFAPFLAMGLAPRTNLFANTTYDTVKSTRSPIPSNCCFVVQDVITEYWWEIYLTTAYSILYLTSITVLVTPNSGTTITNTKMNVYQTNTTTTATIPFGQNPVGLFLDSAPQPEEVIISLESSNGTQIVTAGITIQSPQAFLVFSTVKVITVPPVTDSDGQVVCVTSSALGYSVPTADIFTISGINSNAEAYFSTYGYRSLNHTQVANGKRVIISPITPGIVVSFPTPYVYIPSRGINGQTGDAYLKMWSSGSNEDFGYVPDSVVSYMANVPAISSQYPGIASCLPGGPSIIYYHPVLPALPLFQLNAPGLTSSTTITVTSQTEPTAPLGSPSSTATPVPQTATQPKIPQEINSTPSSETLINSEQPNPMVSIPSSIALPSSIEDTHTPPQPTGASMLNPVLTTVVSSLPSTSPILMPAIIIYSSSTAELANTGIPLSESMMAISGNRAVISRTTEVLESLTLGGTTEVLGGSTQVVGGMTEVLGGSTQVVGGITEVLRGSIHVVGGTTEVIGNSTQIVVETKEVPGSSTQILGGTTEIIPTGTQTIALSPTRSLKQSSRPVQATGSAATIQRCQKWRLGLGMGVLWMVMG